MCRVTKAAPIQFINSRCYIKKRKSCKPCLSGYYACSSHDLLLMPSGQTHTHTHTPMSADETISRNQAHMGLWPECTWFKKGIGIESKKYANKLEIKKVWKHLKMELSDHRTKG